MTRIQLPPDHNHAVIFYKRHLSHAFLCDADEAVALACASKPPRLELPIFFLVLLAIALVAFAFRWM